MHEEQTIYSDSLQKNSPKFPGCLSQNIPSDCDKSFSSALLTLITGSFSMTLQNGQWNSFEGIFKAAF